MLGYSFIAAILCSHLEHAIAQEVKCSSRKVSELISAEEEIVILRKELDKFRYMYNEMVIKYFDLQKRNEQEQ